ncbi:hypothetical protein Pmani_036539 [Petrolisthes manimaculis]|uniref:Uncharacterized protein n=1 Tax=Petrolisthes manimaculis TaxID=1843537 RepID=A0AAE1TPA1_9EUCA|nr:hypothetical protein Pmani_036539 [Petrolisthes manimaculis]
METGSHRRHSSIHPRSGDHRQSNGVLSSTLPTRRKASYDGHSTHSLRRNEHAYRYNPVPKSLAHGVVEQEDEEDESVDPQKLRRMQGIAFEVDIAKKCSKLVVWLD